MRRSSIRFVSVLAVAGTVLSVGAAAPPTAPAAPAPVKRPVAAVLKEQMASDAVRILVVDGD
ncbi:hypothetical protein AB0C77_13685, partial [Streptomyces sp. NPDC048629]|uniref:hypothetical protein n=1 Tax=Streptomyces sp. NPDC048629 TaxID=3154824 RepID=UPI0034451BBD